MSNSDIVSAGPPAALPTGPRGRGIAFFENDGVALTAVMTDGTRERFPLPVADPEQGGIDSGDPNAIPLSQDVKDYVTLVTTPMQSKNVQQDTRLGTLDTSLAALTKRVEATETTDAAQTSRLDSISTSVADIIAKGATDAELAKAIADLSIADYLKKADAAAAYAPKAHVHAIADVTGLDDKLETLRTALSAATGVDLAGYATLEQMNQAIASSTSPYLKSSDAQTTYATKTEVAGKYTTPTSGTTGHVVTWTGSGLALQALPAAVDTSGYLLKTDAANTYALKAHTHLISDVVGLQAALDAKLTSPTSGTTGHVLTWTGSGLSLQALPAGADLSAYLTKADAANTYQAKLPTGTATGQVLTWDGSSWTAQAVAGGDTSGLVPKSAYSAKGDILVGSGSATYAALPVPGMGTGVVTGSATGAVYYSNPWRERWSMTGTVAVKTGAGRAYNPTGNNITISALHAAAGMAPAGSGLTVALRKNGTQIATVTIPAGGSVAETTGLAVQWATTDYLTVDVTAIGSSSPGADLVVTVKAS